MLSNEDLPLGALPARDQSHRRLADGQGLESTAWELEKPQIPRAEERRWPTTLIDRARQFGRTRGSLPSLDWTSGL